MSKFKIGDKVRYLGLYPHKGLSYNYITKIIDVKNNNIPYLISCPEGRVHYKYDGTNAGWWVSEENLELAINKGEQLLFSFMED